MARIEIKVPETLITKVGEYACECQKSNIDMEERVAKIFWTSSLNDTVKEGDILCELDTGKAVGEIKSPVNGQLKKIIIAEGGICRLGNLLCIMETQ